MLWIKSLQDLTANAPFQRLRKNLLLLLQVLILIGLVFALARPFVQATGTSGSHLCVLIDRSGSMLTAEKGGTRLDLAKKAALAMVDDMRMGDEMMVVSFAAKSEVLCELTGDRYRLREAIRSIEAVPTSTKVRDAILVAHSLKGSIPETQIIPDLQVVLISDGNISDLDEVGTRAFDVDFLQVGESHENAGITAFSVRTPPEEQGGPRQCFVLIHNASDTPLDSTLTLTFNEQLLTVEEVQAPPQSGAEIIFTIGELGEGILKAELDNEDALPLDNTAWLALRPAATIRALLVAEGQSTSAFFLKRVLMLEPRVELSSVSPGDFLPRDDYDLVVFDNFAPEELPKATMVFINAVPPLDGVALGDEVKQPPIIATDSEHPMMRFLNPSTVSILKARHMEIPGDARVLMSSKGTPLMADVSRGGNQVLVLGFDLADSNWPWHLSFPLFVQNLLAWVPRSTLSTETYVVAGRPITIMPDPLVETAEVTLPDGSVEQVTLDPARPSFFGGTERLGVYLVTKGVQSEQFAVNLLDPRESDIPPSEALSIGRSEVTADRGSIKQNKELWRWFVGAALAVLMLEWFVYTRRAWL
jgi:hypothetical protein